MGTHYPSDTFGAAAVRVLTALRAAGFEAAVVGGPVRDLLRGVTPKDVDITSNATADQLAEVLAPLGTLWEAGRSFGTVGVSVDGEQIEVTTWRTERYDGQTRKPIVGRAFSLKEDLERRDFTINAMAMVAEDGGLRLVDYFCGRQHLEEQVLATPGDPQGTFWDDPLRIVRLWRFQILLGFQVEPETLTAARRLAHRLKIVSQERITAELARVAEVATIDWPWAVESAYMLGIEDRLFGGLASPSAPQLVAGADSANLAGRLAWLAVAEGLGPELTEAALEPLRLPTTVTKRAAATVRAVDAIGEAETVADYRRIIRKTADDVLADARRIARFHLGDAEERDRRLEAESQDASLREELPVNGHDVTAAGFSGRQVGEWLRAFEEALIRGRSYTRDEAVETLTKGDLSFV